MKGNISLQLGAEDFGCDVCEDIGSLQTVNDLSCVVEVLVAAIDVVG